MLAPGVAFGCPLKSQSTPLKSSMAISWQGMLILPSFPILTRVHIRSVPALFGTIPNL